MSTLRMTTVSSPAVSASAFTRGAVVTPIDGLNVPDMRDLARVDGARDAEEARAAGVAAERGADRDVQHAVGRARHQRHPR